MVEAREQTMRGGVHGAPRRKVDMAICEVLAPAGEVTAPKWDALSPARAAAPPAREGVSPAGEVAFPAREASRPAGEAASPARKTDSCECMAAAGRCINWHHELEPSKACRQQFELAAIRVHR